MDGTDAIQFFRVAERILEMGGSDPESGAILREVACDLAGRTDAERAVIALVGPASGSLEVKALHGFGTDPPPELSQVDDGILGWALKGGAPVALSGAETLGGIPLLPFERTVLLAAPIAVGDKRLGAASVLRSPRAVAFGPADVLFVNTVMSLLGGMIGHARAETEGRNAVRRTIESLTMALDARDSYTRGHSQRVAMFSLAIANELEAGGHHSFGGERRNALLMSALLHDIGKIGIRDEVLFKPSKLTEEEYELVKSHPEKGAEIVRMIPGFDESVIAGIQQHHERWDGKGYPLGLEREGIHLFGRIIGLADAFDAIVTSRPYQNAGSFGYAKSRVQELSGIAFDPEIVRATTRALKDQQVWHELGASSSTLPVSPSPSVGPRDADDADHTLKRVFGRSIEDLPTLPHVVSQVLEKTRNPDSDLDEVVRLISNDQALVSTYLRLVNSAFYGFNRRITTLKQAITLLGYRSVRNVVVNAGVVGIFRKRTFNTRHRRRLWDHSVACGVASRLLAEHEQYKAREEAFTAGLLHDIGKVVIDQYAPRESAEIQSRVEGGLEPRVAEREVLGVDHARIGSWIADRWHLPKTLCEMIERHHEPDAPTGDPDLVRIVATANAISHIQRSEDADAVARDVSAFVSSPANLHQLDVATTTSLLLEVWTRKADALKTFGDVVPTRPATDEERVEVATTEG
jgi:putative nucleotidyltransferase with HDIG domain